MVSMVGCTSWLALVLMLLAIPVSDTFAFLESIPLDITHGAPAGGLNNLLQHTRAHPTRAAMLSHHDGALRGESRRGARWSPSRSELLLRSSGEARTSNAAGVRQPQSRTGTALFCKEEKAVTQLSESDLKSRVESELNLRDLGGASLTAKGLSGRVLRTACLHGDRAADLADVVQANYSVKAILDLRSEDEMTKDRAWGGADVLFSRERPPRIERAAQAWGDGRAQRYVVPLLSRENLLPGVRRLMPPMERLAMLVWGIVDPEREQAAFIREINKGGLPLLNILMLECARPELSWALQLLITLLERSPPADCGSIAIQCRLGKDRTGLLSALLLLAVGASHEEVVADYARSDGMDEIALGGIKEERVEPGKAPRTLDRQKFTGAEAATMESTILHMCEAYGSVEAYLDAIGIDATWRARLRAAAAPP